jgi:hypothetical protein
MKTGQVFVSHTSDMAQFPQGRSFVQAALDAVGRAEMAAVDMRYFAAREGEPAEYCRARVRGCEIYVAVIGFRYGTAVPGEVVSYSELEFEEAGAAGLPRLVFLLASPAEVPAGLADADRGVVEGFRQRLRDAGLVVRDRLAPRAADPAAVAEVVGLAGFLPLAVSLLARVFARHPSWTLADLAADTRAGLLTLTAENSSIAPAFGLSYRHLDPAQRRFFALLGLHPGGTTDSYAAALAGVSPADAGALLDGLHAEGLPTETGYRRYGMHNLMRRYARDHAATSPGTGQALGPLLDYYQPPPPSPKTS